MTRAYSMKDAVEHLEKLPEVLTREGAAPVVAVLRRGQPVLAVLPWDLYVGLLQTLANLPEDVASAQREGIRALLDDTATTSATETHGKATRSAQPHHKPPHRRHPGR